MSRREDRGFTLVELLSVIAVILILVTLLVPLSVTIRERSQRAVCISNMRNLQLAFNFCTVDRNGGLPSADTDSCCGNTWSTSNDWWSGSSDLTTGVVWPYIRDAKVYACPAYPEPARTLLKRHYSINTTINSEHGEPYGKLSALSQVKRPARTHVFIEEYDNRTQSLGYPSPGAINGYVVIAPQWSGMNLVDCPAYWHDMGANFTYLDGHAEYRKWVGPMMRTVDCYTWWNAQAGRLDFTQTPLDRSDFDFMLAGLTNAY
jgi:prepilin-type N-terminal cleavage/methylation domain-containing protein/prepilin-type processing-associated H-X9-DG protein